MRNIKQNLFSAFVYNSLGVPIAAGIIIGVGNVTVNFGDFSLGGIALGTIVTIAMYHVARAIAPREMVAAAEGATIIVDAPGAYETDEIDAVGSQPKKHRRPAAEADGGDKAEAAAP